MQRVPMTIGYPIKYVPTTTIKHPVFVRNDEIPTMLIENSFFHNKVCIKPSETIRHHSSGFKLIFVSSSARKYVMVDLDAEMLVNFLLKTPFHDVVTIKSIPQNLGRDPLEPRRGATIAFVQPIIPYSRPFRRPLNYPKYKKNSKLDVHVQVFKADIKANNETVDEKITNLFNCTLKDDAYN